MVSNNYEDGYRQAINDMIHGCSKMSIKVSTTKESKNTNEKERCFAKWL